MKVTCNHCESTFHEDYLAMNGITGELFCPICDMPIIFDENEETENYKKFKNVLEYNIGVPTLVNFDKENDDALVMIVHDIVKELKTDKKCPHCDAPLYCSDLPQYDYVCVECEENFYECEVK